MLMNTKKYISIISLLIILAFTLILPSGKLNFMIWVVIALSILRNTRYFGGLTTLKSSPYNNLRILTLIVIFTPIILMGVNINVNMFIIPYDKLVIITTTLFLLVDIDKETDNK